MLILTVQDGCSDAACRDAQQSCRQSLNAIVILFYFIFFDSFMCFPPPLHCRSRMLLASAVVVWEWLNEHGRWRPYSPAVCHHIEAVIRSDPRCGSVVLGQVDSRLSPYIIDLHSMHQFRQDTGERDGEEEKVHECCCTRGGGPFLLLMCYHIWAW